jgi:hypothetical protein
MDRDLNVEVVARTMAGRSWSMIAPEPGGLAYVIVNERVWVKTNSGEWNLPGTNRYVTWAGLRAMGTVYEVTVSNRALDRAAERIKALRDKVRADTILQHVIEHELTDILNEMTGEPE